MQRVSVSRGGPGALGVKKNSHFDVFDVYFLDNENNISQFSFLSISPQVTDLSIIL
jgi:hypothetical protein